MDLTTLDLLLFYNNFEPSRIRLWEFVRRFDPLQFSAFLYLLENVQKHRKTEPIMLDSSVCDEIFSENSSGCRDIVLEVDAKPYLNLNRGEYDGDRRFAKARPRNAIDRRVGSLNSDPDISVNTLELLSMIKSQCEIPEDRTLVASVLHNTGTQYYRSLVDHLRYLLFSDNLQCDREGLDNSKSVVLNYLQYYKMFALGELQIIDPKKFRYFIVPRPRRVHARPTDGGGDDEHLYEYFYSGMHLVVDHSSSGDTRSFNRHGEHQPRLLATEKFNYSATFEAVLVPTDQNGKPRSWHYWDYRSGYRILITDIFRFENQMLLNVPFAERLKYRDRLVSENSQPAEIVNWSDAVKKIAKRMYHYISGIMIRGKSSLPNEVARVYRFPITSAFDLLNHKLVNLKTVNVSERRLYAFHYMLETAEFRTVCLVYAHTNSDFYIFEYNEKIHQFEHACTLKRLIYDKKPPNYKSENLMILNAKIIPMGVFYIRVYYDKFGRVYGYEHKFTSGKYDVPITNRLLAMHKTKKNALML